MDTSVLREGKTAGFTFLCSRWKDGPYCVSLQADRMSL